VVCKYRKRGGERGSKRAEREEKEGGYILVYRARFITAKIHDKNIREGEDRGEGEGEGEREREGGERGERERERR
jgi:hypothetical protein